MTLPLAIALGAVFGLSLTGIWAALRPTRPALAVALEHLESAEALAPAGLSVTAARFGVPSARVRTDLVVISVTESTYLRRLAIVVIAPFGLAAVLIALGVSPVLTLIGAGGSAFLAGSLVGAAIRSAANDQRRRYLRALATYLHLCALNLTGGAGVESALHSAAAAGRGREFAAIRTALDRAVILHQTPWEALGALGRRIGVPAYQQLAATTGLAGTEGARIRKSLTDRSRALRTARKADDEALQNTRTEQMSLPSVLTALGFIILIVYAAIANVLGGL
ncbi:secretion system protein [Glycomyces sp. NPDC046736]|uniref:secretion system protein n=1 Tax=Glycomyces sp. NPDC046736 TaxID=3155615 RepID=UPI0033CCFA21